MRVICRLMSVGTGVLVGTASLGGCFFFQSKAPIAGFSPAPLASPTSWSDFEQDRVDILSALASDSFEGLFTAGLINDGIGIFSVNSGPPGIGARRWGRQYASLGVDLRSDADVFIRDAAPRTARIELSAAQSGVWLGDFPWRTRLVTKAIADDLHREALLAQNPAGEWELTAVSPGIERPENATVAIADIALSTTATAAGPAAAYDYSSAAAPVPELPSFWPGQTVGVVLHATGASASAFVYGAAGSRQQLSFAGVDPSGMRFVGSVAFPSGPAGPAQLGFDVVAPGTLDSPQGAYDATLWGVPVVRQGGAR